MKHRIGYSRLNRNSSQRKALIRGLSTQLIIHGRIETTLRRAKAIRTVVERLVTMARVDTVGHRQLARGRLYGKDAVAKLFSEVAIANKERPGGYTRVVRLGFRPGDHGRRAILEFVEPNLITGMVKDTAPEEALEATNN